MYVCIYIIEYSEMIKQLIVLFEPSTPHKDILGYRPYRNQYHTEVMHTDIRQARVNEINDVIYFNKQEGGSMPANVQILTNKKGPIKVLDGIKSYNFEIINSVNEIKPSKLLVVDTYLEDKTRISKIPFNQRSCFFPVKRIAQTLDSTPELFFSQLSKDQTIFTKHYTFIDETPLPTEYGDFILFGFSNRVSGKRILGLRTENIGDSPHVRAHSMCYTGDIFHSKRCDCREELEKALKIIAKKGGLLVYPEEEGRGIGILNKITIYNSQHSGYDTVDAQYINNFPNDLRDYDYMRDVFDFYHIKRLHLITNNPLKEFAIEIAGKELLGTVKIESTVTDYNRDYLMTKMNKNNHNFMQEFIKGEDNERN